MITEVRIVRYLCESGSGKPMLKVEVVRRRERIRKEISSVLGAQSFRFVHDGYEDATETVWTGIRDQEDGMVAFEFWSKRLGTTG